MREASSAFNAHSHFVFSCAQTIMANSSVHLFSMIDLIFGPLVGLREFGTSLLCNPIGIVQHCNHCCSIWHNTMIFNVERKGTKQFHLENCWSLSQHIVVFYCIFLSKCNCKCILLRGRSWQQGIVYGGGKIQDPSRSNKVLFIGGKISSVDPQVRSLSPCFTP